MRLWEALDHGLLARSTTLASEMGPTFAAFASSAGDTSRATSRGCSPVTTFAPSASSMRSTSGSSIRSKMRALGFCAGIHHARFMAERIHEGRTAGDRSRRQTPTLQTRREAVDRASFRRSAGHLHGRHLQRGRRHPRSRHAPAAPTDRERDGLPPATRSRSSLVAASGKSVLTVLDFIGQAHAEYRFDIRYRALIGGTRSQIARAIEQGFPLMPPGCAIRLDEIAQEIVLDKPASRAQEQAASSDRRPPRAPTAKPHWLIFSEELALTSCDVYARPGAGSTFTAARRLAGHLREPQSRDEAEYGKALGRLLHVNDDERYERWRAWLVDDRPPALAPLDSRDGRLQLMLYAGLGLRSRPLADMQDAFEVLWASRHVRDELVELLDVLRSRGFPATAAVDEYGSVPIHSHASYSRLEIIAGYGLVSNDRLLEMREGVVESKAHRTDLFFVTLDKSGEGFSPTTRYNDYPISPTRFHWESQNRVAPTSATGQRYINHIAKGSRVVLFVRERDDDERGETNPYVCLGPMRYLSHQSSKPMQIVWELERPMPPEIYDYSKAAAG